MRGYTGQIKLLVEAASEAAGVTIRNVDLMEALVKRLPLPRRRGVGVPRYQGMLPLSPARIRDLLSGARHRENSNVLARAMLRVLGPDSTLKQSYPLYVAFSVRLGLAPWSLPHYRRYAFGYVRQGDTDHVLL